MRRAHLSSSGPRTLGAQLRMPFFTRASAHSSHDVDARRRVVLSLQEDGAAHHSHHILGNWAPDLPSRPFTRYTSDTSLTQNRPCHDNFVAFPVATPYDFGVRPPSLRLRIHPVKRRAVHKTFGNWFENGPRAQLMIRILKS